MSALIPDEGPTVATLVAEVRQLIADARLRAASAVNAELTGLYWQVGQRIHREILGSRRAGYGEAMVSTLSRQLSADYGRGFSARSPVAWRRMRGWVTPGIKSRPTSTASKTSKVGRKTARFSDEARIPPTA